MSYSWTKDDLRVFLATQETEQEAAWMGDPNPPVNLQRELNEKKAMRLTLDLPLQVEEVHLHERTQEPVARLNYGRIHPPLADTLTAEQHRQALNPTEYAAMKWIARAGYGQDINRLDQKMAQIEATEVPVRRAHNPYGEWDRITEAPQLSAPGTLTELSQAIDRELPYEVATPTPDHHHEHLSWMDGIDEDGNYVEHHVNTWDLHIGQHPAQPDEPALIVSEEMTGQSGNVFNDGEVFGYQIEAPKSSFEPQFIDRDASPADIAWEVAQAYESVMVTHQQEAQQQYVALQQIQQQTAMGINTPGVN